MQILPNKLKVGVQTNKKYWSLFIIGVVVLFVIAVLTLAYKIYSTYEASQQQETGTSSPQTIDPDQSLQTVSQKTDAIPNGLSTMVSQQNNGQATPQSNAGGMLGVVTPALIPGNGAGTSPGQSHSVALQAGAQSDLTPSGFSSGAKGATSPAVAQMASPQSQELAGEGGNLQSTLSNLAQGANGYSSQNGQDQKSAFAMNAQNSPDALSKSLQNPLAHLVVTAGTIIPAELETGINSDLPGQIIAVVRENVYDSTVGNSILIPQGSKLLGVYDSNVTYGQSRVLIVWNRVIYPNGQYIDLQGMPGADLSGYAGLSDQVNNHYIRIFGSALLMSLFSAGVQLSQPQTNNSSEAPSSGQIIAGAVGQNIGQLGVQMTEKNLNIQPTIMIRPGDLFNVLVTRDIPFAAPYGGDNSVTATQSGY